MTNDTYFVLEQLPQRSKIVDFRGHDYTSLARARPEEYSRLSKVDARDFLRGLADYDPTILTCQSRVQLVGKLEAMTVRADEAADGNPDKREVSLYCAVRDNTYQLIDMLK